VEAISPGGFGTITRLLVDDGDTVSPGEPIFEFVERRPTLEEWREQYEMTERLRARIDELQRHFERGPWHAWWITLRRRYRNTDKPIPVWGNNPEFVRRLRAGEIGFETVGQAETRRTEESESVR
jgi:pyruvate/2-oxoglutarate dehydrogenase complex dihydrolipoamide acyltransferase (E2) component